MDETDTPLPDRPLWSRIGICLLNLINPGLGLVRLGDARLGLLFLAGSMAVGLGIGAYCQWGPALTFGGFTAFICFAVIWLLGVFGGSILLTWRRSRALAQRDGWLWRWYGVAGLAVVLALAADRFTGPLETHYRAFYIPAQSMEPLLEVNDRVIARMSHFGPIRLGDVVIVRTGDVDFVKRVVAMPGDTIELRRGVVVLNGKSVPQLRMDEFERAMAGRGLVKITRAQEQFPGEVRPHEIFDAGDTPQDVFPRTTLGPGQYFLLGDHRDNSLDSRFSAAEGGLGSVSAERIVGRVLFRYWRSGLGFAQGRID